MKKYIVFLLITLFFLNGCSGDLPIYELEGNFDTVVIDGTEYALNKLSYNGDTYISEPEQYTNSDYYEDFQIGKQIGKTNDDLRIHQVKNDDKRLVMKGFMLPAEFFKLDRSY